MEDHRILGMFCRRLALLVFAVVLAAAMDALAETWERAKIVTTDGKEYSDVSVRCEVDQDYLTIIDGSGSQKQLEHSMVRSISDQVGQDITELVKACGAGSRKEPDQRPVREAGVSKPRSSKKDGKGRVLLGRRFTFSPSAGFGYATTTGDWFEGLTSGMCFDLIARFGVGDHVFIGGGYRYQALGVERYLEGQVCGYNDYGEYVCGYLEWDVNLHEFMLVLGFMTNPDRYTTPIAYGSFGIGATKHNIKLTATVQNDSESAKTDETKLALFWDVGLLIPFNETIGLDIGANMRATGDFSSGGAYSTYSQYDNTGLLFGFRLGLAMFLGRG